MLAIIPRCRPEIRRSRPECWVLLVAAVSGFAVSPFAVSPSTASEPIRQDERQLFETHIRPVLVKHCYECHSHETGSLLSDYAIDSPDGMRDGGASGQPAVVPGDPDSSPLLQALRYEGELQMPPDEQLSDEIVQHFENWIAAGAPDPRSEDRDSLRQKSFAESAESHWAFQPPIRPEPPVVNDEDWPRTAADRFVLAKLEGRELRPVGDAEPEKLIRRVYFDLIGLPPSPQDVARFVDDPSESHFAEIVDDLLDSPRFGERWGRHWLDVSRYAESSGMEFNFTYPHAWPFRDYVIDSFNDDKPYDRFVTEQIAGDLLPADSPKQRDENRLATGFLAIGPKRHNDRKTSFRMDVVDDQIRTTSEALLGLTVGCARCHDHKFDPVPTEDYYALAGVFLSTDTLHGTTKIKYSRHPSGLVPFGPDAEARHEEYETHQTKLKDAEEKLSDAKTKKGEAEKDLKDAEKKLTKIRERLEADSEDADEPEASREKQAKEVEAQRKEVEAKEQRLETLAGKIEPLKSKLKKLKENAPQPPEYGMGVTEGEIQDTHVAIGGDPGNQGDSVPRGFLSAITLAETPEIEKDASGRLALARWITSEDNPLTARVMVNRVWHHLFGRGLVPSVNNFGSIGEPPSHPELLDHLAVRFVEEGWSVKRLIRSLVLSRSYQMSTRKDPGNMQLDPENVWRWRMTPRRLEVEPLRDAILTVSGQIDLSRPDGSTVTQLGQQLARQVSWEKLNPESNRRSVYLAAVRHYAPHMMQEFDVAASSLVVGDRAETTTSQQALFFLNSDFVLDQALATARSLIDESPDDPAARIRTAYRRAVSRAPTAIEVRRATEFVEQTAERLSADDEDPSENRTLALASFVQTLFGSAEFRYLIHSPSRNDPKVVAR